MIVKRKSTLVIVAIGLLCCLFFAYLSKAKAQNLTPTVSYQGQNTNVFQMFFSPHVRADTFLVDTAKGSVWVLVSTKTDDQAFQKVPVEPAPVSTTA